MLNPSGSINRRWSNEIEIKKGKSMRSFIVSSLQQLCKKLSPTTISVISPREARREVDQLRATFFKANPNLPDRDFSYAHLANIPQELQFAIDCLPVLSQVLQTYPRDNVPSLLDFGPGYGAGANLFATLFCSQFLWCKVQVDALDARSLRQELATFDYPLVNYRVGEISGLPAEQIWNIIYCSNVIEHVGDPNSVIAELIKRAKDWVILYAPYREIALSPGHQNRITEELFQPFSPELIEIKTSLAWGNQQQILVLLRGQAFKGKDYKTI